MSQAPTIISGGATGADKCWATESLQRGMDVHVCTFEGHRRATLPPGARLILLAPGHRVRFWAELQAVAQRRHLQPRYEPASYVSCLLLRNAMLARHAGGLSILLEPPAAARRRGPGHGPLGAAVAAGAILDRRTLWAGPLCASLPRTRSDGGLVPGPRMPG